MKRIFFFLLLFVSSKSFAVDSLTVSNQNVSAKELADSIIADTKKYLGVPYHYGGRSPQGFDCSGLVGYIYERYGILLPRTADAQATRGIPIYGSYKNLQKGDLLFFGGRSNYGIGHVGIFIELDDSLGNSFSFIHAANGGVQISHIRESYYKIRYRGARRVLPTFMDDYTFDTTAVYPSDTVKYEFLADFSLDSLDKHVILYSNGRWAFVDSLGKIVIPQKNQPSLNIILSADGYWSNEKKITYSLPTQPAPPKPVVTPTTIVTTKKSSAYTASSKQYYKVKSGDTLGGIAKKYGTTVKKLCGLNNLKETTILKIGQSIRVK